MEAWRKDRRRPMYSVLCYGQMGPFDVEPVWHALRPLDQDVALMLAARLRIGEPQALSMLDWCKPPTHCKVYEISRPWIWSLN